MKRPRNFASDNNSGICPEAWTALEEANQNHALGYGDDRWTKQAADLIREVFETDCEVFFVFNGTAANSLSLASTCRSYHSILCHENAHVEQDECGAPEFYTGGGKLVPLTGIMGKITAEELNRSIGGKGIVHHTQPSSVSITQVCETGEVYQLDEIKKIAEVTHKHNLNLHMDGARFANALVSLDVSPAEMTWKSGVDVLSFGATKNGCLAAEAIIFFNKELVLSLIHI